MGAYDIKQINLVGKLVGEPIWGIIDWEAGVVVCELNIFVCELGVVVGASKQSKYHCLWS